MRAHLTISSLLALALFGLAARPAQAESPCTSDADCVKGWTCGVSAIGDCAAPACAPGGKCEAPSCETANFKSCQPLACRTDSDCASDMVCYSHTETNCPPSACAKDQECPAPSCEPKTESMCVPRYVLPCTTASDCGTGFKCEPDGDECTCSGSAGVPGDGGAPQPPEESCVCEPSKDMRCHAPSMTCTKDSDCSSGWTCKAFASPGACATNPAPNTDPGSGGAPSSAPPPPDCAPPLEKQWQCVPPYYNLIEGSKGGDRDYSSTPTPAGHDDSAIPPTGGETPNASGSPASDSSSGESSSGESSTSAGCSVAHGSRSASTLALFGVLGMLSALRRRRPR